jgi:hypothetical protein
VLAGHEVGVVEDGEVWAGMVVAMPSMTISSSARIMRAMAVGRSLPHTMSLPTRLS